MLARVGVALLFCLWEAGSAFELTNRYPAEVTVREDDSYTISCQSTDPWEFCSWSHERSNQKCSVTAQSSGNSVCEMQTGPEKDPSGGADYPIFQLPDAYTCTLRIPRASRSDLSSWVCSLVGNGASARKTVQVNVYSPTAVQFTTRPRRVVMAGNEEQVECSGIGGNPHPVLLAFVGKDPGEFNPTEDLTLNRINQGDQLDADSGKVIFNSLFTFTPSRVNHGSYVKCVALQTGILENQDITDIYPPQIISQPFDVVFAPLAAEELKIIEVDLGAPESYVTLEFYANPTPSSDQVIWHIARGNVEDSLQLAAGMTQGRFSAKMLDYSPVNDPTINPENFGLVRATLVINNVSEEDLGNHVYLTAANEHGLGTINFQLTKRRPAGQDSERPDFNGSDGSGKSCPRNDDASKQGPFSGLGLGAIIGIVIGILAILLFIGLSIGYCKREEKLCFKPAGEPRYKFDVELQDVGKVNPKANRLGPTYHQQQKTAREHENLLSASPSSGAYQGEPSIDEVDENPNADGDTPSKKKPAMPGIERLPQFNGKPIVNTPPSASGPEEKDEIEKDAEKRQHPPTSAKRQMSYLRATNRESVQPLPPKWPEDKKPTEL